MQRPAVSLQARALRWLAQREHSRSELRRKLLRVAQAGLQPGVEANEQDEAAALAARVEQLLDALHSADCLCEERFVASRARVREARFGTRRIQQELQQHGLRLDDDRLRELLASEWQRASAVWHRRFVEVSADPRERARQMRFLAGRGFSAEVIRRVVAGDTAASTGPPATASAGDGRAALAAAHAKVPGRR